MTTWIRIITQCANVIMKVFTSAVPSALLTFRYFALFLFNPLSFGPYRGQTVEAQVKKTQKALNNGERGKKFKKGKKTQPSKRPSGKRTTRAGSRSREARRHVQFVRPSNHFRYFRVFVTTQHRRDQMSAENESRKGSSEGEDTDEVSKEDGKRKKKRHRHESEEEERRLVKAAKKYLKKHGGGGHEERKTKADRKEEKHEKHHKKSHDKKAKKKEKEGRDEEKDAELYKSPPARAIPEVLSAEDDYYRRQAEFRVWLRLIRKLNFEVTEMVHQGCRGGRATKREAAKWEVGARTWVDGGPRREMMAMTPSLTPRGSGKRSIE